ncbi:uncharacterized protein LOC132735479 [Ruditapes philippinarum]|uniref:uncharacterized protein LOC132735479 n=1 Tax=Ruditapes philippinarum TaxID=129788 RepID=UPI00295BC074|nr:uncharacterized protein LOC132735479 [Ruditapes philippinarum]
MEKSDLLHTQPLSELEKSTSEVVTNQEKSDLGMSHVPGKRKAGDSTMDLVHEDLSKSEMMNLTPLNKNLKTAFDGSEELKDDLRSLRRKIRKLEERVATLEKGKNSDPDEEKLKLVEHLENDVQKTFTILVKSTFTDDELINSSRTGKRSNKCIGDPRPPLDSKRLETLERLVCSKTKLSKESFIKKLENLQKTLRQKIQKQVV